MQVLRKYINAFSSYSVKTTGKRDGQTDRRTDGQTDGRMGALQYLPVPGPTARREIIINIQDDLYEQALFCHTMAYI